MGLQNGIPARNDGYQGVQYLRKRVTVDTFGQGAFVAGVIPAGAIFLAALSGVDTSTVFNAATTNRFQIGIAGAVSKYGLNLTAAALGFAPCAVAVGHRVTVDTPILVTPDITGGSQTTGDADILIAFLPPN